MYGKQSSSPRERFIAQFEWDGVDAIYRADRIGTAWRISADQYHRFLDSFERRRKLMTWGSVAIWVLAIGILGYSGVLQSSSGNTNGPLISLGYALFFSLLWGIDRGLRHGPARALRTSPPLAPALAGDERLARTIGDRSWKDLFAEMTIFALLLAVATIMFITFEGTDRWLLLGACVVLALVTPVQMLRKWRLERRRSPGSPALI